MCAAHVHIYAQYNKMIFIKLIRILINTGQGNENIPDSINCSLKTHANKVQTTQQNNSHF